MPTPEILFNLFAWFIAGTVPAVARHYREDQGLAKVVCNAILSGSAGIVAGGSMYVVDDMTFQLPPLCFALTVGIFGEAVWHKALGKLFNGNGKS